MADVQVLYRFGAFTIDTARRELLCDGEPVVVQARVFDLLTFLAGHSDRVVDKNELQDAVWPRRVITDAAMSRAIMKARQAVGDDAHDPAIIKTVYGRGFHFVADVERIEVPPEAGSGPAGGRRVALARPLVAVTAALVVVAVVFIVAGRNWLNPPATVGSEMTGTPARGATGAGPGKSGYPENSIAVLPFVNMSDDAANEYFSDGVAEELRNLLAQIPELRVTSHTSAFSIKGRDITVAEIARELNVAHLLEGSVRKAGNQVRITAQLIDARSDTHLWSETYDRDLDDIFAIQDEIALAVVNALKLTLLGETPKTQTIDAQAYAMFLQARYLNAQGTGESFAQSIDLYEKVLEIAPDYARAWRGMAVNYVNQANKGLRPKGESYALAREAVNRALTIDPNYAKAHALLGVFAMTLDRDLAAAAPHFQHALSLAPNDPVLQSYASSFLLRLGRLDEVIKFREFDVANDPLDPIGHNNLAWAYVMDRRADEAIDTIGTLLMLAPKYNGAHNTWGKALLLKGEFDAALEAIQQELSEVWRLFGLVLVYHALGRAEESDLVFDELVRKYYQDWSYYIAVAHAYRGEADEAFEWLHKAVEYGDTSLTYAGIEPLFDNIRSDPRWLPFLENIGMAPEQLQAIEFNVPLPDSVQ